MYWREGGQGGQKRAQGILDLSVQGGEKTRLSRMEKVPKPKGVPWRTAFFIEEKGHPKGGALWKKKGGSEPWKKSPEDFFRGKNTSIVQLWGTGRGIPGVKKTQKGGKAAGDARKLVALKRREQKTTGSFAQL